MDPRSEIYSTTNHGKAVPEITESDKASLVKPRVTHAGYVGERWELDERAALDRLWFDAHPSTSMRFRPADEHEVRHCAASGVDVKKVQVVSTPIGIECRYFDQLAKWSGLARVSQGF